MILHLHGVIHIDPDGKETAEHFGTPRSFGLHQRPPVEGSKLVADFRERREGKLELLVTMDVRGS